MELREKWVSFCDVNWRIIVKIGNASLFKIFLAMTLPDIVWIGLQVGKLPQK